MRIEHITRILNPNAIEAKSAFCRIEICHRSRSNPFDSFCFNKAANELDESLSLLKLTKNPTPLDHPPVLKSSNPVLVPIIQTLEQPESSRKVLKTKLSSKSLKKGLFIPESNVLNKDIIPSNENISNMPIQLCCNRECVIDRERLHTLLAREADDQDAEENNRSEVKRLKDLNRDNCQVYLWNQKRTDDIGESIEWQSERIKKREFHLIYDGSEPAKLKAILLRDSKTKVIVKTVLRVEEEIEKLDVSEVTAELVKDICSSDYLESQQNSMDSVEAFLNLLGVDVQRGIGSMSSGITLSNPNSVIGNDVLRLPDSVLVQRNRFIAATTNMYALNDVLLNQDILEILKPALNTPIFTGKRWLERSSNNSNDKAASLNYIKEISKNTIGASLNFGDSVIGPIYLTLRMDTDTNKIERIGHDLLISDIVMNGTYLAFAEGSRGEQPHIVVVRLGDTRERSVVRRVIHYPEFLAEVISPSTRNICVTRTRCKQAEIREYPRIRWSEFILCFG